MGEEIGSRQFDLESERQFREHVRQELDLLRDWFECGNFEERDDHFGMELEGWLFDQNAKPAPKNREYLAHINHPQVVHEIAKFNIELNSDVHSLSPHLLSQMHGEISHWMKRMRRSANDLGLQAGWIGIPPTLQPDQLTLENMTPSNRYYALAERVIELRKGEPAHLRIERKDQIHFDHPNVMMEAAATSVQFHTQVKWSESKDHYNAAQWISAPMIAISANSPFLFEKKLWDETRVPVFEQAVALAGYGNSGLQNPVTFGKGWVKESLIEIFEDNLTYPCLLCPIMKDPKSKLKHLKLMNGQVWRWNRPIVGIPEQPGQKPHLRIEHRPLAAGPSSIDLMANFALYLGLLKFYAEQIQYGNMNLPSFEIARSNFYSCAQWGMKSDVIWIDGKTYNVQSLLLDLLLPQAKQGLEQLELDADEISEYLGRIMTNRIRTGWSGAAWQKSYIDTHGSDFKSLMQAYLDHQASDRSIVEWKI
jgi:hypothetical protein